MTRDEFLIDLHLASHARIWNTPIGRWGGQALGHCVQSSFREGPVDCRAEAARVDGA